MTQTLKSLVIFVVYNLAYGMKGGIDNAAHLGGLLSGAALGAFVPRRVSAPASMPGLSPYSPNEPESGHSTNFKLAGAALSCVLVLGFGTIRRAHSRTDNSEETMHLELLKLKDVDRTNLQDAAKLVESGKPDDAAVDRLKTVALHAPASTLAHIVLAEAYSQRKQYAQSVAEFRQAIALRPSYAPAHAELGLALLKSGQYDQSIQEERKALRLDPENSDAHNNLGVALERSGDLKGALEEYRTASTLDPKDEIYAGNLKRLQQPAGK